jgi:hypothetical protein
MKLKIVLLTCGILSSLLWIGGDILASIMYQGYSFVSQSISELSAIGAPTRPLLTLFGIIYEVLLFAFGLGVLTTGSRKRAQSFTGTLLMIHAILGLASSFFPMTLRGGEFTTSDIMHIIFYTLIPLVVLLTIGFGAYIHGKKFRVYSIVTILLLVVCWALTAMAAPRIAAGLPTPWVGIYERLNVYGYMQWVMVLAISLLRAYKEPGSLR